MDIRSGGALVISTAAPRLPPAAQSGALSSYVGQGQQRKASADVIQLSNDSQRPRVAQTRLLSESIDPIENGFRRTQVFERADKRTFTRIEEFAVTDRGSRRNVIQQNVSGSVTQLEEAFDQEEGGTFRRTQRFTDVAGETRVQIETGFNTPDPFVLSSRPGGFLPTGGSGNYRGTRLDLTA